MLDTTITTPWSDGSSVVVTSYALAPEDQAVVRRVSALLRVADGLDRGHTSNVDQVTAALRPEGLVIEVAPRIAGADLSLECWGAERKSDVLAKLLGRDVVIRAAV